MLRPLFQRVKQNAEFRVKVFLCLSFIGNIAYSVFLFTVSRLYSSKWFFALSVYYGLFSLARIFIFAQMRPIKSRTKILTMLACGGFLLMINLAVSAMTFVLLFGNHSVKHHEITVITLATYTFSALTVAIVGCVKYLKRKDYVFSCAKIFSLISASVSFIPLTHTMLTTFGGAESRLKNTLFPILCIAVACFITICAVYMICRAYLDWRAFNHEEKRE